MARRRSRVRLPLAPPIMFGGVLLKRSKQLDQWYTKPRVAVSLTERLLGVLPVWDRTFIEPSAGTGVFVEALESMGVFNIKAFDIDPQMVGIDQQDFLKVDFQGENLVAFGNPPFGKRSRTAVQFFNHCAKIGCEVIAFIVPVVWERYEIHKKLNENFQLVWSEVLPKNSFIFEGKDAKLNTIFQIWCTERNNLGLRDLRLYQPPPIRHNDFDMYLYNNTKSALKVFDNDFDVAVPRQGFQDYNRRETHAGDCEKYKQWMLFKAKTPEVLERIMDFDFISLAEKQTTIRGYGKADFVKAYADLYDNGRNHD